ncbi:MAG: hypothetical protein CO090_04210 [Acidobacteria bacterium CG_4_9_14_3_um_filter_49_7]|nr:MAG: hypothetical protein CO090_04210 [Acidobacteria bacterium CG_4_9_14_3_um_filter_49_7]
MKFTTVKILFLMSILSLPQFAECGGNVWYVGLKFEPTLTVVQDIPVASLDQSWILARCLTKKDIPQKEMKNFEKYDEPLGLSFEKKGDFNGDGKPDRAVVGVYKDKDGNTGRFLLVLTRRQNKWVKSVLFKRPGRPGFSILGKLTKKGLGWDFCMECDDLSWIKWEKNHFVLIVADDEVP